MAIVTTLITTPIGALLAGATEDGICLLDWPYRRMIESIKQRIGSGLGLSFEEGEHAHFDVLRAQLSEYFAGARMHFELPLVLVGSDFQKSVWSALQEIPYGDTRSYKAQSIFLKNEKAIRAVAKANGENGLAIVIPCHRVIGEDGALVGYAGGLRAKEWLLRHERVHSGKSVEQTLF
jgi:methylated-DNA-[protein]-cysteine S-methyltransferase